MRLAALALLSLSAASCGGPKSLDPSAGIGPDPTLPDPHYYLVAPVRIAPPVGWKDGQTPTAAPGLKVAKFAGGLTNPRWLYVLPNGDVLAVESDGPAEIVKRPKDLIMTLVMKKAHGKPPPDQRILLFRDTNGDGVADSSSVFLDHLNSPFGMALVGNDFYVANTDALLRFPYRPGAASIREKGVKVTDLPAGPINHHWTKNVIPSRDGSKLYVTVGSNSNVGENGMENEVERAAILEVDARTGAKRVFASGLRNPNGMDWEPNSGALWTSVNERDEIGNDLVPDYITSVKRGAFYGWPFSYYGQHPDKRPYPRRPDMVARAVKPDYAVGSHAASLGFTFANANQLGPVFREGAFVGQHGSWNRQRPYGYKVIFVPFSGGRPVGRPRDVLSGFLDGNGDAFGRPVGVTIDKRGGLLVADDAGGTIWRVTAAG